MVALPNLFEYNSYRNYLRDYYVAKKAHHSKFSYRFIASKVGFKSAGHFTQIIKGKANLSPNLTSKFIDFLKLKKKEADYFETLVLYEQSKSDSEKMRHFEKLYQHKEAKLFKLESEQAEFYECWYYAVVREIISFYPFRSNYQSLAKLVDPPITTDQAKKSIEVLERLNLIRKNKNGCYEQTEKVLSGSLLATGPVLSSYSIKMMDMAKMAADNFSKEERNLSWLGFCVPQEGYEEILQETRRFRRRLLEIANSYNNANRSFHVNLQLFPTSKPYQPPYLSNS